MKKKQFSKKLKLNKKTVANLDNNKMENVKGGIFTEQLVPSIGGVCVAVSQAAVDVQDIVGGRQ